MKLIDFIESVSLTLATSNPFKILESFGFYIKNFIPGFLAGLLAAKAKGEKGVLNYTFRAFAGALTANYFTPIVANKIEFLSEYSIAFVIGLLSMDLIKYLLEKWKELPGTKTIFKSA